MMRRLPYWPVLTLVPSVAFGFPRTSHSTVDLPWKSEDEVLGFNLTAVCCVIVYYRSSGLWGTRNVDARCGDILQSGWELSRLIDRFPNDRDHFHCEHVWNHG